MRNPTTITTKSDLRRAIRAADRAETLHPGSTAGWHGELRLEMRRRIRAEVAAERAFTGREIGRSVH